jgi:uncharacterized glyoxalase superfamily protein PhnB
MANSFKPKNTPALMPYLTVRDTKNSIDFYTQAFGFETINIAYDDKNVPMHAEMKKGEALIMFCYEGAYGNSAQAPVTQNITMPLNIYVYCEDVDALYGQAIKVGAKPKMAPSDGFWGDRFCTLLDLDGYEWSFATYLGEGETKH